MHDENRFSKIEHGDGETTFRNDVITRCTINPVGLAHEMHTPQVYSDVLARVGGDGVGGEHEKD
jgi:hypothetical protein